MHERNIVVTHVLREGDKLTDYYANVALNQGEVMANSLPYLEVQGI